jgi:hypothetical protein
MRKFSSFHAAFMTEILSKSSFIKNADQSDQSNQLSFNQLSSKQSHISNLSSSSAH